MKTIRKKAEVSLEEIYWNAKGDAKMLEKAYIMGAETGRLVVDGTEGFRVSVVHGTREYWSDFCETYTDAVIQASGNFLTDNKNE